MTDTDLDIILAIADGRLTGRAKRDALARIATDPELGEALASQIAAMDELKSLEPALMTPSERAALRSALVEQLNLQPVAPVVEMAKLRRAWWQPVLGLASAAALLIAIVVVPSMFSSGDDSSADFVAIAPEASTSAETVTELDAGDTDTSAAEGSEAEPGTAVFVVPQVTAEELQKFFATLPPPPDSAPGTTIVGLTGAGVGDESQGPDDGTDSSTSLRSAEPLAEGELVELNADTVAECLTDLGDALPSGELVPIAATLDNGQIVAHFGSVVDGQVSYSISIVLDTCTISR